MIRVPPAWVFASWTATHTFLRVKRKEHLGDETAFRAALCAMNASSARAGGHTLEDFHACDGTAHCPPGQMAVLRRPTWLPGHDGFDTLEICFDFPAVASSHKSHQRVCFLVALRSVWSSSFTMSTWEERRYCLLPV